MTRFNSPFETGYRPSGWRWYWRFLREYEGRIVPHIEADCYTAIDGLVWC